MCFGILQSERKYLYRWNRESIGIQRSFIQDNDFIGPTNYKTMMLLTLILIIIISFPFVVVLTINQSYNKIGKSFSTGKAILENSLSSKISIHFIIDRLSKIFTKKRTFAEGVQTVDFMEHIHSVKLDIPEWKGDGLYEVTAQTKEGTMHPAFLVYHWHADSADTIIFNHGAFEYPFDRTFRHLFKKNNLKNLQVNLIIVRMPFHQQKGELKKGIVTLSKFMATMAASTQLTEEILKMVKNKGAKKVEVAGLSLGGVIANRHHVIFDSADYYVPIIAGSAHEKLFIHRNATTQKEIERNRIITQNLNFTAEWNSIHTDNVFPVAARYDDYCRLYEQGPSYGNCPIEIWNLGHLTTTLSHKALQYVLLRPFIQ